MTGRRPKRSDRTPMTGEKKNCIAAKIVPNHPSQLAALTESPARKSRISFGKTGAIKPSASMSSMMVMKIKTTAAGRDFMIRIAAIFTCHSSLVTRHSLMTPLSCRSPKTEVRESKIHGRGLFAAADIAKDEIVAVKGGHIISRKQLREKVTPQLGPVEIQIDEDLFIAPVTEDEREGSMLYSNHCCDANL